MELDRKQLASPFGAYSRDLMLQRYFEEHPEVTGANAWQHVYRLLLWIDPTTSLAHCYESDKSQPGRHWYGRTLTFHKFVSDALGVGPKDLHKHVDVMFKSATSILAVAMLREQERRDKRAKAQREPYADTMPHPGENPELAALVESLLREHYGASPPASLVSALVRNVSAAVAQENKRKNLVGEGFEDTLAAVIGRLDVDRRYEVKNRKLLEELPGFQKPRGKQKARRVDLCLVEKASGKRTLVSAKWSVRADREEQFAADFDTYRDSELTGVPFDFVLVTNEFDAARVVAACVRADRLTPLFKRVVHLNTDALALVHPPKALAADLAEEEAEGAKKGSEKKETSEKAETARAKRMEARRRALQLPSEMARGQLVSLGGWIDELLA